MDIPFIIEDNRSQIGYDYVKENSGVAVPYLTLLVLVMVWGTFGNILVIFSVLIDKKLRKVENILIINLAIADLCVTAYVDPLSIAGMLKGESWFVERPALCEFTAWLCLVSCFCSLVSLGFIALNRYIRICHNALYVKIYTMRNTIAMCIGIWVFSIIVELPNFFGWGDHVYDDKTSSCVWDRTADLSYSIFFSVVGVACPIILITICYIKIYVYLHNAKARKRLLQAGEAILNKKVHSVEKQAKELTRTAFICFVVFTVCWIPYAIVVSIDYKDVYPLEVHLYVVLIAHANSSCNSIIYGLSNRNFRRAYLRLLCQGHCMRQSQAFRKSNNYELPANLHDLPLQEKLVKNAQAERNADFVTM